MIVFHEYMCGMYFMYSAPEQESQIPKNPHKELFWLQSSVILLQLSVLSKNLKFEKKKFFTILAIQKPYKYTGCFVKFWQSLTQKYLYLQTRKELRAQI